MEFGEKIVVDCNKPEWLKSDEPFKAFTSQTEMCVPAGHTIRWTDVQSVALPVDHPYYCAAKRGYRYWHGHSMAPTDWDGWCVLLRNGNVTQPHPGMRPLNWSHNQYDTGEMDSDIIGYKIKSESVASPVSDRWMNDVPRWALERAETIQCAIVGIEPNMVNVDTWLENPHGWSHYFLLAAHIARTEFDPVELGGIDWMEQARNAVKRRFTENPSENPDRAALKIIADQMQMIDRQAKAIAANTVITYHVPIGAPGHGFINTSERADPVPMIMHCVLCGTRHIDEPPFDTKPHHTHACQGCGHVWRPAKVDTVGVQFLPGYKNDA